MVAHNEHVGLALIASWFIEKLNVLRDSISRHLRPSARFVNRGVTPDLRLSQQSDGQCIAHVSLYLLEQKLVFGQLLGLDSNSAGGEVGFVLNWIGDPPFFIHGFLVVHFLNSLLQRMVEH